MNRDKIVQKKNSKSFSRFLPFFLYIFFLIDFTHICSSKKSSQKKKNRVGQLEKQKKLNGHLCYEIGFIE